MDGINLTAADDPHFKRTPDSGLEDQASRDILQRVNKVSRALRHSKTISVLKIDQGRAFGTV